MKRYLWPAYALLLLLLSALAFGDLRHHLLNVDDQSAFDDSQAVGDDLAYLFSPPAEKQLGSGRPVAEFFKWLAYLALGNNPGRFHLLVVLVHVIASALLARVSYRLGLSIYVSLASGLLFLVNVAHFGAVHWISALDYGLALVLGLCAILLFRRYCLQHRVWNLCAFYLTTLAGIMTHAAIGMLIPFCFFLAWIRREPVFGTIRVLLPLLVLAVPPLYLAYSWSAEYTTTSSTFRLLAMADLVQELPRLAGSVLWLLGRTLSTAHWLPFPPHVQPEWEPWLGAGLLGALIWLLWQRDLQCAPWAAWTVLTLVPFVPTAMVHTGISRYLYLATAGTSVLLACGLSRVSRVLDNRRFLNGRLLAGVMLSLITLSSVFALDRAAAVTYYASGRHYFNKGDFATARMQLHRAIDHHEGVIPAAEAYFFMVLAAMASGGSWEPPLEQALKAMPDDRYLQALKAAAQTIQVNPHISHRGKGALRRIEESSGNDADALRRLLAIIYDYLGVAAQLRGDHVGAAKAFRFALDHDAGRRKSLIGLGIALRELDRGSEAARLFEYGLEHNPDDSQLRRLLEEVYIELGDSSSANEVAGGAAKLESRAGR